MSTAPEAIPDIQTSVQMYRISRTTHTALFPPPNGTGRFDDPERLFRVLYAALDRRAAFAESLQLFRPDLATRAALRSLRYGAVPADLVRLDSWAQSRSLSIYRLPRTARLFDLRTALALEQISDALAPGLLNAGVTDIDASILTGPNRGITQMISGWAHANEYDGLVYPSRLGTEWTCCAVFDRIKPRLVSRVPIAVDDPDLQAVATAFGIVITG